MWSVERTNIQTRLRQLGVAAEAVSGALGRWDSREASAPSPTQPSLLAAMAPPSDLLARTDAYVKKRDGVDKLLKLMRYTAALAALGGQGAGGGRGEGGGQGLLGVELVVRLSRLESTLGTARKALRMGKFLGNAVSLRDACATIASGDRPGPVVCRSRLPHATRRRLRSGAR